MQGVAKALFVPLDPCGQIAMVASFLLSMMLVPVLAAKILREKDGKTSAESRRNARRFSFDRFSGKAMRPFFNSR